MYSYCGVYSVHMFSDKPPFIPDTSNREFPADFLKENSRERYISLAGVFLLITVQENS